MTNTRTQEYRRAVLALAPEALLSYGESAIIMNVSVKYITELAHSGQLDVVYWGPSRQPRIPRFKLREWIEAQIEAEKQRTDRILSPARRRG